VIIGADGPLSTVGRWIESRNENPIPAIQCKFSLVHPLSHTEVYFDRNIFGGYGWLFPKGREANVGLGMRRSAAGDVPMRMVFSRFYSRLIKTGKIEGAPYQWTAGWIPTRPLGVTSRRNILLAGDAAGHTHPISGAGVHNAILCGEMAGEAAARAVKRNDMTLLHEYETEWRDFLGDTLHRAFERRQVLEKEWDRLPEILPQCWIAFRAYYDKL
jgi:flavin-dependent dehydrogenase